MSWGACKWKGRAKCGISQTVCLCSNFTFMLNNSIADTTAKKDGANWRPIGEPYSLVLNLPSEGPLQTFMHFKCAGHVFYKKK